MHFISIVIAKKACTGQAGGDVHVLYPEDFISGSELVSSNTFIQLNIFLSCATFLTFSTATFKKDAVL